jgi:hypothetical protein
LIIKILGHFSRRSGDFHTATVKNAMKIVATAQMVRSFMSEASSERIKDDCPLTSSHEACQDRSLAVSFLTPLL